MEGTKGTKGKEQVLKALSQAASKIRERLGESLSSIQKFDAPLELTTSSLEALKAYSLAFELARRGKWLEAIPFYQHAVELDPTFAYAYIGLAIQYYNTSQPELTTKYTEKAFALRDRVSEYEKLRILHAYYKYVTGDLSRFLRAVERCRPRHCHLARGQAGV
jgi:tetratricopeptide (TPR) repeat protein